MNTQKFCWMIHVFGLMSCHLSSLLFHKSWSQDSYHPIPVECQQYLPTLIIGITTLMTIVIIVHINWCYFFTPGAPLSTLYGLFLFNHHKNLRYPHLHVGKLRHREVRLLAPETQHSIAKLGFWPRQWASVSQAHSHHLACLFAWLPVLPSPIYRRQLWICSRGIARTQVHSLANNFHWSYSTNLLMGHLCSLKNLSK